MASKPNTQSHRILLYSGYAALLVGFLIAGVVPCVKGMNVARADVATFQEEIDARLARARELQKVNAEVTQIEMETRDFERLVPPNQDLGFLTELAHQLDASGMKNVSLHSLAESPLMRSQKVPVEVRGKGTYGQFREFMTRLETLQRLCSVGKLSVDADTDLNGMVDVQLTLYFYYAKPAN